MRERLERTDRRFVYDVDSLDDCAPARVRLHMNTPSANPYEPPLIHTGASRNARQALAVGALVYSGAALCIFILAGVVMFLFVPDNIALGTRTILPIVSVIAYAILLTGLVANMIVLGIGNAWLKLAGCFLAIIYGAILVGARGELLDLLQSAMDRLSG